MSQRARLVIVKPGDSAQRFKAIDDALLLYAQLSPVSVLFEGVLPTLWQPSSANAPAPEGISGTALTVHNLGFGCPCCIGSLPLTVTLTRILRQERPQLIILAPLPGAHIDTLSQFLAEKFSQHLEIGAN